MTSMLSNLTAILLQVQMKKRKQKQLGRYPAWSMEHWVPSYNARSTAKQQKPNFLVSQRSSNWQAYENVAHSSSSILRVGTLRVNRKSFNCNVLKANLHQNSLLDEPQLAHHEDCLLLSRSNWLESNTSTSTSSRRDKSRKLLHLLTMTWQEKAWRQCSLRSESNKVTWWRSKTRTSDSRIWKLKR